MRLCGFTSPQAELCRNSLVPRGFSSKPPRANCPRGTQAKTGLQARPGEATRPPALSGPRAPSWEIKVNTTVTRVPPNSP